MRRVQTKHIFKLRLLALVLALALLWYSLNPTPAPVIRRKREDELPDEKKRKAQPQSMMATEPWLLLDDGEDDFEWPEFIDG